MPLARYIGTDTDTDAERERERESESERERKSRTTLELKNERKHKPIAWRSSAVDCRCRTVGTGRETAHAARSKRRKAANNNGNSARWDGGIG